MSITKKLRFEVFKRDNFTCQYCGKQSPQIVLEIDHIIPRSEGGGDSLENLITSCFECNRGKGKELLENFKEGTDPTEQAILLLERERQLKEYNAVIKKIRTRKNRDFNDISKYWHDQLNINPHWFPAGVVRYALDYLPKEKILEAIDVVQDGCQKWEDKSWGESFRSYFSGIIRNWTNDFGRGFVHSENDFGREKDEVV